jgi:hypothetical protein
MLGVGVSKGLLNLQKAISVDKTPCFDFLKNIIRKI